jgi:acetyl-CoA carboxylase carboxyl transferase subunit beta
VSRRSDRRAVDLIDLVLDTGSFRSWDRPPVAVPDADIDPAYREDLVAARARSGADEAVVTGEGRIGGRPVAVLCSEFTFLGGSIGAATAERLLLAIERATAQRLPLLAATASGGTRMQEGTPAFLRMAALAAAVTAHRDAGLPYLVYLRHPTTGGVFASWGSLGQITVAEPGALIGLLGPAVYAGLRGEPFPPGVQLAENLHAHGLVDAVVPADRLAAAIDKVLGLLDPSPNPHRVAGDRMPDQADETGDDDQTRVGDVPDPWAAVLATRQPDRPGARALLRTTDGVPLAGTGEGERGEGMLLALTRFGTTACVFLGQDRVAQATRPLGPGAFRAARRGMRLATELRLPLVAVIDTPGAALSPEAEQAGLAGEIARCLADMSRLPVPTVSVLLGQGTGAAALALLPADRVIAARHAWLTPLPPEGASIIVHRTPDRAAEVIARQRVTSTDLHHLGAVDTLIDDTEATHHPSAFVHRIAAAVEITLHELRALPQPNRLAARHRRYRTLGLH